MDTAYNNNYKVNNKYEIKDNIAIPRGRCISISCYLRTPTETSELWSIPPGKD